MTQPNSPSLEVAHTTTTKVENVCPSCDQRGQVVGTSHGASVYHCQSCGLCFLAASIRPNSETDNHWYQNCLNVDPKQFIQDMGVQYRRQVCAMETMVKGRALLDVGSGLGIFLKVAKDRGWDVVGAETSEYAAQFAKGNFDIDYITDLAGTDRSFDVVRISHVLEHVPYPRVFLQTLRKALRPGGILAVIVPNCFPLTARVINRLRSLATDRPRLAGGIYPTMHVLGFSPRSLSNLICQFGFTEQAVFTVSMGSPSYYPLLYDGLLRRNRIWSTSPKTLLKFFLPQIVDNLGNSFGMGQWVVGYYRLSTR